MEIAQLGAFSSQDTRQPTSIVCRVDAESTVNIQRKGGAFPAGTTAALKHPGTFPSAPTFPPSPYLFTWPHFSPISYLPTYSPLSHLLLHLLTCPPPFHSPTFSPAPHLLTHPPFSHLAPPSHPPTFPPAPTSHLSPHARSPAFPAPGEEVGAFGRYDQVSLCSQTDARKHSC